MAHDPEKCVRFSDKIMRKIKEVGRHAVVEVTAHSAHTLFVGPPRTVCIAGFAWIVLIAPPIAFCLEQLRCPVRLCHCAGSSGLACVETSLPWVIVSTPGDTRLATQLCRSILSSQCGYHRNQCDRDYAHCCPSPRANMAMTVVHFA
jgi:hypothetical protein